MAKTIKIGNGTYEDVPYVVFDTPEGNKAAFIDCVGMKTITSNGDHEVEGYAYAHVDVDKGTPYHVEIEPSGDTQVTTAAAYSDGYIDKVTVYPIDPYTVGESVKRQATSYVTPTKSRQKAVEAATYTTGDVYVEPIPSQYIVPSGEKSITSNGRVDVTSFASVLVDVWSGGGGDLPANIKSIASGDYYHASATNSTSTGITINHGLGEVPDIFIIWAVGNIATTYTHLWAMRSADMGYRSSYVNFYAYHGNSATNVTVTNGSTYCIRTLDATKALIVSSSSSYYWRPAEYRWVAVKFF